MTTNSRPQTRTRGAAQRCDTEREAMQRLQSELAKVQRDARQALHMLGYNDHQIDTAVTAIRQGTHLPAEQKARMDAQMGLCAMASTGVRSTEYSLELGAPEPKQNTLPPTARQPGAPVAARMRGHDRRAMAVQMGIADAEPGIENTATQLILRTPDPRRTH